MRILRLARIVQVALRYGLDEFLLGHERFRAVRPVARALTFWRDVSAPRAVRLRLALEDLGPIFVKFGQMLSTRRQTRPGSPTRASRLPRGSFARPPQLARRPPRRRRAGAAASSSEAFRRVRPRHRAAGF